MYLLCIHLTLRRLRLIGKMNLVAPAKLNSYGKRWVHCGFHVLGLALAPQAQNVEDHQLISYLLKWGGTSMAKGALQLSVKLCV